MQVLSKDWKLDGDGHPARPPVTYGDVAKAIGLLLEEKADIHATGQDAPDSLMAFDGGPILPRASSGKSGDKGKQCYHCRGTDHGQNLCPTKAAKERGDYDRCMSNHQKTGAVCQYCSMPGHEKRHHDLAASDFAARKTGAQPKAGGQGGGGQGGGGRGGGQPPAKAANGRTLCKWGAKCRSLKTEGKCDDWHEETEYKKLLEALAGG